MSERVNLREWKWVGIIIILTFILTGSLSQLQINLNAEELRDVYLGLALWALFIASVWSLICAYLLLFYALKSNINHRLAKMIIIVVCSMLPWISMWGLS